MAIVVAVVVSDGDMQRMSQALLTLYGPGLDASCFAHRSTAFLAELVPAELVVLGALDRRTGSLDLCVNQPVPGFGDAMNAFARHMQAFEVFNWDPEVADGGPFFLSDFIGRRQFRATGMYSDVYRKLGIDNHCAVLIPGVEKEIAFFGIERRGGPDYSEADRSLLRTAQAHLANARALGWARSDLTRKAARPAALQRRGLTTREAEVLCWISEGKSNDEIAMLLKLKLYTIKGYVKTIFQKIGAANRLGAALWALQTSQEDRESTPGDRTHRLNLP